MKKRMKKLVWGGLLLLAAGMVSTIGTTEQVQAKTNLKKIITKGFRQRKKRIYIPVKRKNLNKTYAQKISKISNKILTDHSDLYYVNIVGYRWTSTPYDRMWIRVNYASKKKVKKVNKQVKKIIRLMNKDIGKSAGKYEKALYLHDYLCSHCEYDYKILYLSSSAVVTPGKCRNDTFTPYGALVKKKAVCSGYARAYGMLCQKVGIPSKYVASQSMNHAWNLVKLNKKWYHTDVTYDSCGRQTGTIPGEISHQYFLESSGSRDFADHTGYSVKGANDTRFDNDPMDEAYGKVVILGGNYYYLRIRQGQYVRLVSQKAGTHTEAGVQIMENLGKNINFYINIGVVYYKGALYYARGNYGTGANSYRFAVYKKPIADGEEVEVMNLGSDIVVGIYEFNGKIYKVNLNTTNTSGTGKSYSIEEITSDFSAATGYKAS
mgnify:CR=1 FL=1